MKNLYNIGHWHLKFAFQMQMVIHSLNFKMSLLLDPEELKNLEILLRMRNTYRSVSSAYNTRNWIFAQNFEGLKACLKFHILTFFIEIQLLLCKHFVLEINVSFNATRGYKMVSLKLRISFSITVFNLSKKTKRNVDEILDYSFYSFILIYGQNRYLCYYYGPNYR